MVRATRSSVAHHDKVKDKTNSVSPSVARTKHGSKKRKRVSLGDHDEQPASKQLREDDDDPVKEEEGPALELTNTGDLPLKEEDAQKILDVLEMIDTQGLLDRVFPLPTDLLDTKSSPDPSSSKLTPNTYSLRTLLRESHEHPLRVLRAAIQHLFPISSQPRSRTSPPAAQQLRFCQIAISLLGQASINSADAISINPENIFPCRKDAEEPSLRDTDFDTPPKRRKYALMQKLPGGDWWSSLNSDFASPAPDAKDLKALSTAHAELVSILPSPSYPSGTPPTLGDFYTGKKAPGKAKLPVPRLVSSGSFLDYGPYASFAPSFDNEGCDVGRFGLGSVMWTRHEKSKAREKAKVLREKMQSKSARVVEMEVDQDNGVDRADEQMSEKKKQKQKAHELLECLLIQDEAGLMRSALKSLELEEGVDELLKRNAKALVRLEELQLQRLGGAKRVIGTESEEWDIAQKIMDSLTLLASLRPRSSTDSISPLVPPQSVLRALHLTVPCDASHGWHGTLSDSQQTSLRDDTTVLVKSHGTAPLVASANTPAAISTAQTPGTTYATGQPYPQQNFAYPNYSQPFRGAYPYPGQTQATSYYPNYPQATGTPQSQSQAQHSYANANQSHQYPYAGWYANYQPATTAANTGTPTPGTNSGRGTPQPAAAGTPGAYPGYFTPTTPAPARAVANTVSAKPQQNGWATGGAAGYAAPTLPPHLRPAGTATPTTPAATPVAPGFTPAYYQGYQSTPPAGR